jgi:hypothetical protein
MTFSHQVREPVGIRTGGHWAAAPRRAAPVALGDGDDDDRAMFDSVRHSAVGAARKYEQAIDRGERTQEVALQSLLG